MTGEPSAPAGLTPPHDLESEAAVISAVILDPSAFDQVADVLRPEHFYSEAHRRIYEASMHVHEAGGGIDVVLVGTRLRDTERLAQIGGWAYLTEVMNAAPAVAHVRRYAGTVVEKWIARQVILTCQKHAALGYGAYGNAPDFVNSLAADVHAIACHGESPTGEMIHAILVANMKASAERSRAGLTISGLATGFDRFDRLTGGLHDGELTIIAARPGIGKTSLAMNMAVNVASTETSDGEHEKLVAIFSLEMPRQQIVDRMVCSAGGVDVARLRCGMLSPTDWSKLSSASGKLDRLPIYVDDAAAISLMELRAKARRLQTEALLAGQKLAAVFIDYLQLMKGAPDAKSREQEIGGISRGLKQLAKELGLPVIALSQLNRAVETRGEKKKRPQLSDLRESGSIEQDADNVVFIYRDDYYDKESEDRGIAELILGKQRNGPTDTVKVKFDAQYTRFDNLPDGYADEEFNRGN